MSGLSAPVLALAATAGGLGAIVRGEVASYGRLHGWDAPRATALVNVVGASLLGALTVLAEGDVLIVVGAGLLGGLTTFSTWMVEIADVAAPLDGREVLRRSLGPVVGALVGISLARLVG